jgi:hypothetical protein
MLVNSAIGILNRQPQTRRKAARIPVGFAAPAFVQLRKDERAGQPACKAARRRATYAIRNDENGTVIAERERCGRGVHVRLRPQYKTRIESVEITDQEIVLILGAFLTWMRAARHRNRQRNRVGFGRALVHFIG